MSREVVKYGNHLNRIQFSNLSPAQANIFFAIISRLRNQGSKTVTLNYRHLARLSRINYGHRVSLFSRELSHAYHKIDNLDIYHSDKNGYGEIHLFSGFYNDKKHQKCYIRVNPDFTGLLNHLARQFTRFSLSQYTVLKSRYAKTLFRIIKMFRTTGNVYLPMKKFRRVLGIPKSYTGDMITRRITTPCKIQLTPLVRNLHIITQRKSIGNRITGYHITFKPDNPKYDKLAGFQSKIGSKKWMLQNIKYSQWLTSKQKEKAYANIVGYKHHQHNRYSMKTFNHMLKTASLRELRRYLALHQTHSHLVDFSEYQVRKLKKEIIKRHKKNVEQTKLF